MEAGKRLPLDRVALIKEARVFLPLLGGNIACTYAIFLSPGRGKYRPKRDRGSTFWNLSQWDYLFIGGQWRPRPAEWTVTCIRELRSRMIDHHAFLFWEQESVQVEEGHRLRLEYIRVALLHFRSFFSSSLFLFSRRSTTEGGSVGSLPRDGVDADGGLVRNFRNFNACYDCNAEMLVLFSFSFNIYVNI